MREFTFAIAIDAPLERAWAVMSDLEAWPAWTPTIARVEPRSPGPPAAGSSYRVLQPKLPPAVWTVTDWSPPRGFTWVFRAPGIRTTGDHRLEPKPTGCALTLRLRNEGPVGLLVAGWYRAITARYVEIEARSLKACCEAGAASAHAPPPIPTK